MQTPSSHTPAAPTSVASLIDAATKQLDDQPLYYGHGTSSAAQEARWLVLGSLGWDWESGDEALSTEVSAEQQQQIQALLEQRISTRKPAAYLLGECWFAGLPFYVDERTIVPRSPFAEIVQDRFSQWLDTEPKRILDLCCGSGCIGIAAAVAFPNAQVDIIDLSPDALMVAHSNIQRHGLEDRVQAIESDLFTHAQGPYDLILSNPPYVPQWEYDELPAEYHREPEMSLVAGDDGLELVIPMMLEAPNYLSENGRVFIEVGNTDEYLANCFPEVPFEWIEFQHGGFGVYTLSREQLVAHKNDFSDDSLNELITN